MKLLLVGPKSPPVGGTTVLFDQLCDYLDTADGVELTVLNTSPQAVGRSPLAVARFLWRVFRAVRHHDEVVLHASSTMMVLIVSLVLRVACGLYRKPWAFRNFGGRFPAYWASQSAPARWLLRHTLLRADQLFFETRESVEFVSKLTDRPVDWFPNSRVLPPAPVLRQGPARRFVFISHVKPSKGVRVIIEAAKGLTDLSFDIYGPLGDGMSEAEFAGSNVNYGGTLKAEEVIPVLSSHDVLLLPTFYEGEGYPGIILEAFAAGVPVITTDWRCIPELTNADCAILVEPESVSGLREAIETLAADAARMQTMRRHALARAGEFANDTWDAYFLEKMRELLQRRS
ncbi:glycosyltransferase family 4 protein [Granulosicoccaceae sp. 1_MG-2023]|nr:glycosyltransferase family 4 protein [Granulosicoccaceae sp. 1_MG-2023]